LMNGKPLFDTGNDPDADADAIASPNKPVKHYTVADLHPMYKKRFEVQRFNRLFLEKFLLLAQEHHIPVYWVTMPVLPAVYESRRQFQFEQNYHAFLNDLQVRYDVRLLQTEFMVLGDENFRDSTHLNRAAAEHFTALLGRKLLELSGRAQINPRDSR
jgi:hypothetical protein